MSENDKLSSSHLPTAAESPLRFPSGPQERHIDFPAVRSSQARAFPSSVSAPLGLRRGGQGGDGNGEGTEGCGRQANFLKLCFAKVARLFFFFYVSISRECSSLTFRCVPLTTPSAPLAFCSSETIRSPGRPAGTLLAANLRVTSDSLHLCDDLMTYCLLTCVLMFRLGPK